MAIRSATISTPIFDASNIWGRRCVAVNLRIKFALLVVGILAGGVYIWLTDNRGHVDKAENTGLSYPEPRVNTNLGDRSRRSDSPSVYKMDGQEVADFSRRVAMKELKLAEWVAMWYHSTEADPDQALRAFRYLDATWTVASKSAIESVIDSLSKRYNTAEIWSKIYQNCSSPHLDLAVASWLRSMPVSGFNDFEKLWPAILSTVKNPDIVINPYLKITSKLTLSEQLTVLKSFEKFSEIELRSKFDNYLNSVEANSAGSAVRAIDYFTSSGCPDNILIPLIEGLRRSIGAEAATKWLVEHPNQKKPTIFGTPLARSAAEWSSEDPGAVTEFLNQLEPCIAKDFAIAGFVSAMRNANPELTDVWIGAIRNSEAKQFAESVIISRRSETR